MKPGFPRLFCCYIFLKKKPLNRGRKGKKMTKYDEKSMSDFLAPFRGLFFHVSARHGMTELIPAVPSANSRESSRARVCVSGTLEGCLKGRYTEAGEELAVYVVDGQPDYKPTVEDVCDVDETNEHWFFNKVRCQQVGVVKCHKTWNTKKTWN
jgi:hypothetical protein